MPNKSIILTASGLAGFIFACFLFFYNDWSNNSLFHEIEYDPRLIAKEMLKDKRDSIIRKVQYEKHILDSAELDKKYRKNRPDGKPLTNEDNAKRDVYLDSLNKKLETDTLLLKAINTNYFSISDTKDSSLAKKAEENLKVFTNLDSLHHLDKSFLGNGTIKKQVLLHHRDTSFLGYDTLKQIDFKFVFYDPELGDIGEIYKILPLDIHKYGADVDLFTKYPTFGVWALLILLYCSAAAMIIVFCCYNANNVSILKEAKVCKGAYSYGVSLGICLLLLALFVVAIDLTFYDGDALKDLYFMKGLDTKFKIVSVLGYTTAAFCFAGMIGTASVAKCFKKNIEDPGNKNAKAQALIAEEINKLETLLKTETDTAKKESITKDLDIKKSELSTLIQSSISIDIRKLTDEIKDLETSLAAATDTAKESITKELKEKKDKLKPLQADLDKAITEYADLQQLFKKFLYAIAVLLALLVFCTGTLYSAVDNLAFIKMLKSDLGFSPAPHEFVYLYGALHTGLILLFYLPAQMQIRAYKKPSKEEEEETKKGFLKGLSAKMKEGTNALLVSAPLLASFAQWLLNIIFES